MTDRVWLIVHNNPSVDEGHQFVKSIRDKLKQARIECLQTEADRVELFGYTTSVENNNFERERQLDSRKCVSGK